MYVRGGSVYGGGGQQAAAANHSINMQSSCADHDHHMADSMYATTAAMIPLTKVKKGHCKKKSSSG